MMLEDYDAIIIGGGPNGLSAAIHLQQKGLNTAIFELASELGGSCRTEESTLPGFKHDTCSAIHPLAFGSPYFKTLPLEEHGLTWVHPEIPFAHPFADGDAYACFTSIEETARQLGVDQSKYSDLFSEITGDWVEISKQILGPINLSGDILKLARFGAKAILSAKFLADSYFKEEKTKMLFYGAAAHSALPLTNMASASFGLVLNTLAHTFGWPFPKGGAIQIIRALNSYYQSLGGKVYLDELVTDIRELPIAKAVLLDLTPKQMLSLQGTQFSGLYRKSLSKYKYGAGVFKLDWALSEPIPFLNEKCRKAGTVHLGFSTDEIEASESLIHHSKTHQKPYVLLAQHSIFDPTRAPGGKHTAWAYCHVPNGSDADMTAAIEDQIEKAAPGFKDCVLKRSSRTAVQMEMLNPNLIGGDINGGMQDITQMFTRPVCRFSPYSTPDRRIYICSSSTPPGGGVHGMNGYYASQQAIKDHFHYVLQN